LNDFLYWLGEILKSGGPNINFKFFSSDFILAIDANFSSPDIGKASKLLFDSIIIPYLQANLKTFLNHEIFREPEPARKTEYTPREHDFEAKVVHTSLGIAELQKLYFINQDSYNKAATYSKHHSNAKFFKGYHSQKTSGR